MAAVPAAPVEICDNGIDDDDDGLTDMEDPDCDVACEAIDQETALQLTVNDPPATETGSVPMPFGLVWFGFR